MSQAGRSVSVMKEAGRRRATLDVETTGLSSSRRVVEVAIVISTPAGEIVDRYETTINPQRPVGQSESIHGLSDLELGEAPTFKEVAADVLQLIEGNVVIAHNLPFDWTTLADEFERCGVQFPSISGWCTSRLASTAMGRGSVTAHVRLSDACQFFGIENKSPHTAMGDAEATHKLFEVVQSLLPLPPARPLGRVSGLLRLPTPVLPQPRSELKTSNSCVMGVDK